MSGSRDVGAASRARAVARPVARDEDLRPIALGLVVELCDRLREAGVRYCHWKSNDALALSASGENDLDLLVDRRSMQDFLGVLTSCGFKQARPPASRQIPGVLHYYGVDAASGRFVHVDAQAQLVLGDDTTKNVHVPIEDAYLTSCEVGSLFPVPAPEFELALLVLRLALKHGTWDSAAFGLARLRSAERRELEHLHARSDTDTLRQVVEMHLPQIGWPAWSRYAAALSGDAAPWARLAAGRAVVRGAADLMRRPPAVDTALRCARRVRWGFRHYALGGRNTKRLMTGGRIVAVVGGDGAGKSTLVTALARWLNGPLDTRVLHLGKPPRSPLTVAVKGTVGLGRKLGVLNRWLPNYPTADEHQGRPPGIPWLAWQYVTAADRKRQYRRVQSLKGRGYVVVCDRFPLEQITHMDGSRTRWVPREGLSRLGRRLVAAEQACYAGIGHPDVLLVLRVDPETAVARKAGVDPEHFVRSRSTEVFGIDWRGSRAVLLDAGRAADAVLADARAAVWAVL